MINLINNVAEWSKKVGTATFIFKMVKRQIYKRVLGKNISILLPNNHKLLLPNASRFSSVAYITNGHVDDGCEVMLRQISSGGAFIDVGAHFGFYCAYLYDLYEIVVAVEPDQRNLPLLKETLKYIKNSIIINKAVTSYDGKVFFKQDTSTAQSSISSKLSENTFEIESISIDSIWNNLKGKKIGCIKIDTEGHESEVLKGAINTIETCTPDLLIEATYENIEKYLDWFKNLGYKIYLPTPMKSGKVFTPVYCDFKDLKNKLNYGMIIFTVK